MRQRRSPVQTARSGAVATAHLIQRIVRWLLDTTGGRLRVVPRLSSLAMSMVGVLLVGASVTGMAGASAAPPPVNNPTPPTASGWGTLACSEGSFFGANTTAAVPGQVGYQITTYNDETVINTNAYNGTGKVVPPNNTYAPQWGILDNGTWIPQPMSALSFSVAKITPITATIPTNLVPGTVTGWLLAWDSDQNKTGGDCGVASFPINVPPTTQTLTGHIQLCSAGTEVSGGTLAATGPVTVTSTPNPMTSVPVPAGQYTMSATAPSGYQFVACGGSATIGSPPTTATQTVNVPANGGGTAIFFVQPIVGTLQGHIYLCQGGTTQTTTEIPGGTIAASGPQSIAGQANPLTLTSVAPGSYTVNATAPTNYVFTTCASGGHLTIGTPPTTANTSVVVPPNGTGSAIFYAVPAGGLFVGHIYLCQNGAQTTTEVAGGTIGGTSPSQSLLATANPVGPLPVAPDTYVMTATAPANYVLVGCGGPATPSSNGGTATETVTVPSNGTGTAVYYVDPASVPNNPAITLWVVKTNNANGSGTYSQTESASSPGQAVPFQVVVTNTSSVPVKITSLTDQWPSQAPFSPACANAVVGLTLQPSQSTTCSFTLSGYAPSAGGSVTNTVLVTGCQATDTGNCGIGTSTSTVIVPGTTPSGSVTLTVTKV
ncbi:MAG TPA: hypothetical protein VE991_08610, partial [Acidimicrobiales bacterium]|nr:hypothetical protein [Acidimicrobiales bacterium]